ncbi:MAG TPA: tail fiber domain-containing protein [Bacteroidia bacterium]|jgi:hypothetical protein|nr:tail fiber domain-containing protein [Bacteroidia bacterium]
MKKHLHFFILTALLIFTNNLFAQNPWKTNGNSTSSGDFIGTNNSQPLIFKTNGQEWLRIKKEGTLHAFGQLIVDSGAIVNGPLIVAGPNGDNWTFTGNVNSPSPQHDLTQVSTHYFTVMGGTHPFGGSILRQELRANGYGTETPQSFMHLNAFGNVVAPFNTTTSANGNVFRTDGSDAPNNISNQNPFLRNQWQMFSGTSPSNVTEKGVIFTSPNTASQTGQASVNHFQIQSTLGDIAFRVHGITNVGGTNSATSEVARLTKFYSAIYNNNEGRFSVERLSPIVNPLSMIHIGDNGSVGNSGYRTWMDIGTFGQYNNDNMYFGLKTVSPTNNEIVMDIGTGPVPTGFPPLPRMRFLFTANPTGTLGTATTNNGLEAAHFVTLDGTNPRMGVGDFQTQGLNTDPQNTLEILSSPTSPYWNYGSLVGTSVSGLRFRNLTSASTTVPNGTSVIGGNNITINNLKLLTVDNNGDVVLTDAPPGGVGAVPGAQNGLNNTVQVLNPTGKDELGGILIRHTNVDQSNFDLAWNNLGVFGVGDGLTAGALGNTNRALFNTSNYIVTLASNNSMPAPTGQNVYAGNYTCYGSGGAAGTGNIGLSGIAYNNSGTNVGLSANAGNINFANTNVGVNSTVFNGVNAFAFAGLLQGANSTMQNFGIKTVATNGLNVYGGAIYGVCDPTTTLGTALYSKMEQLGPSSLNTAVSMCGDMRDQTSTSITKYGVQGLIDFSCKTGNIAVAGICGSNGIHNANITNNTNNISVYGGFTGAGIYTSGGANNWAGWFDGNVNINGNVTGINNVMLTSDQMFKSNIDTINNPLAILKQLKPKTFFFDTNNVYYIPFNSKRQYGFIAQDVLTILPELVNNFNKPPVFDTANRMIAPAVTYKNLNYNAFIALLTSAVQKQQAQIEHQDSVIHRLVTVVNSCCSTNVVARTTNNGDIKNTSGVDVELSDADVVVLNQNSPNPFAEQTTITYSIPQNISFAQILFYDINGRQIKAVDITKKGKGLLNVYANDLTNGIYSYTLIVDGKIIDTKKMVKQQ